MLCPEPTRSERLFLPNHTDCSFFGYIRHRYVGANTEYCTPVRLVTYIRKTANEHVGYLLPLVCRTCSKGARRANWDILIGSREMSAQLTEHS